MSVNSLESTTATVSCTVSGMGTLISGIKWYDSSDQELTGGSYSVDVGTLSGSEQTTTLTVIGGVTTDTTYQCEIDSIKHEASINEFSK